MLSPFIVFVCLFVSLLQMASWIQKSQLLCWISVFKSLLICIKLNRMSDVDEEAPQLVVLVRLSVLPRNLRSLRGNELASVIVDVGRQTQPSFYATLFMSFQGGFCCGCCCCYYCCSLLLWITLLLLHY